MQKKEYLTTHKTFSSEWWNDFLEQSDGMKNAVKISSALTSEQVENFNEELKKLLGQASLGNKFRIYIDGVQQDNKVMNISMPDMGESLTNWVKRIFCERKFGMIINQSEQLSEFLSAQIFHDLQPLIQHIGIPLRGYNITIFLGNYGYTPLGIHQDGPGNNVLHYHLGPSEKIMYNWNEHDFDIDALRALPQEEQLLHADKFVIKSGDLFYMPWNKYHIGYTGEFSVGVTVWFNNPTRFSYLHRLFEETMKYDLKENESILPADLFSLVTNKDTFSKYIINQEGSFNSVDDLMYNYFNAEKLKLSSNAYWNSKTLIESGKQLSKNDLGKFVHIVSPYKIYYEVKENHCHLYYRGHSLILKNEPKIFQLIEKLDSREKLTVADILKYLSPELSARETIIFLTDLYQKQSITLS
ncbi:hypothetical protein [Mucilaginibacter lappiensis]|jgi:hypothetical protein|uniref:hypothetical protein n=1 Tax=Mucilaginibacter lappiensis TaxID=354630 RepID=UPI003D1A094C